MKNLKRGFSGAVLLLVVVIIIIIIVGVKSSRNNSEIKIGVVTDLTGASAYWGESTHAGVDILQKELNAEGKSVSFIVEDTGFNAGKAATAAQKLVSIDKVNAIYSELNPLVVATASVIKGKNIPMIYTAAIVSPLENSKGLFFKSYLDYEEGCKQIAQKFKDEGVTKMGVLQANLEFGQLCNKGVIEVYGKNALTEVYNLGDTDFHIALQKINNFGAGAVINAAFEADTTNTLKVIHDYKYAMRFGTVDDTITDNLKKLYPAELKGSWTFGLNTLDPVFTEKLKPYHLSSPYAAAFAYTHLKDLVSALTKCGTDTTCTSEAISQSPADPTIGFLGFKNSIAQLDMKIRKY